MICSEPTAIFFRQVAIDPTIRNHVLVLVKLIGQKRNAPCVIQTLSSSFLTKVNDNISQSLTNTAAGSKRPLQPSTENVLSHSQAACCAQAKQSKLHHPFLTSTVSMVNDDCKLPEKAPSWGNLPTSKASASEIITPFSMGTPSLTTSQTPLNTPISNTEDALSIDSLFSNLRYGISSIEKDRASLQTPSTHVDGISSKYFASCLSSAQNLLANSQENEMNAFNRQNQNYLLTPQTSNFSSVCTTNPKTIAAFSSSCYSIAPGTSNGSFSATGTISSPLELNTKSVNFTQSKTQFENIKIKQEKEDNSFSVSNNIRQTRETNLGNSFNVSNNIQQTRETNLDDSFNLLSNIEQTTGTNLDSSFNLSNNIQQTRETNLDNSFNLLSNIEQTRGTNLDSSFNVSNNIQQTRETNLDNSFNVWNNIQQTRETKLDNSFSVSNNIRQTRETNLDNCFSVSNNIQQTKETNLDNSFNVLNNIRQTRETNLDSSFNVSNNIQQTRETNLDNSFNALNNIQQTRETNLVNSFNVSNNIRQTRETNLDNSFNVWGNIQQTKETNLDNSFNVLNNIEQTRETNLDNSFNILDNIQQTKETNLDNSFNVLNNIRQTREANLEISLKDNSVTSTSQCPLNSSTISISRHLEHLSQASSSGDSSGRINNSQQDTSCTRTSLTIEGDVTNIKDLPSHILEKLDIFTNDALEIGRKKDKDILEKGACGFLLGRQEIPERG